MTSSCGAFLDECRCPYNPVPRTQHEVTVAHRAAVQRARRSGFAREPFPGWLFTLLDPTAARGIDVNREGAA